MKRDPVLEDGVLFFDSDWTAEERAAFERGMRFHREKAAVKCAAEITEPIGGRPLKDLVLSP